MFIISDKVKVLFFLFILALAGCSKSTQPLLNGDATILAFGDSLTFGIGTDKSQSYPAIVEELTRLTVINAGISGETTSQGLKRFEATIEKHQPDLILLLEGGNDILRNQNLNETKQNLAQMIEIALSLNIRVVLIGVPEKKIFSDSAELYHQLAETYQLIYAEDLISGLLRSPQYKSDSVHLNSKGYRELAKGIVKLLQENGVISDSVIE